MAKFASKEAVKNSGVMSRFITLPLIGAEPDAFEGVAGGSGHSFASFLEPDDGMFRYGNTEVASPQKGMGGNMGNDILDVSESLAAPLGDINFEDCVAMFDLGENRVGFPDLLAAVA
jgi:hypothetical protein